MIDELIIHIGPPKTSTTAVQLAFLKSKEFLANQGLHYEPIDGNLAHHSLAFFLKQTSLEDLANLSNAQLQNRPEFPRLSNAGRYMVSTEDFSGLLSTERAQALVRWASPKQVCVVLASREPTRLLWSTFQQFSRSRMRPEDSWTKFVKEAIDKPQFFISQMLKPWLQLQPLPKIIIIDQMKNSAVNTPALIAKALNVELTSQALADNRNNLYNESLELGASMLTPHFNEEVVNELKFRQWKFWGDIPESYIRNTLLYQSSTADAMFELGRSLEIGEFSGSHQLLDQSSSGALQRFSDAWWDDFEEVLTELDGLHQIDLPEKQRVRPPDFTGYNLPIGTGFPGEGFEKQIELPPEFFSLARVYASNIGLQYKAHNRPQDVEWLHRRVMSSD
jgi:hypothetical protein